jgi:hypothetical protein
MNLIDLRGPDGPYWAAYQEERHREGILDDPDYVPEWFLAKLARNRVAEARVVLEQLGRTGRDNLARFFDGEYPDRAARANGQRLAELHAALHNVEDVLRTHSTLEPEIAGVVAALLGGAEEETARERARSVDTSTLEPPTDEHRRLFREQRRALAMRHLGESGVTDADQLTLQQRRRTHMQAEQFGDEWAALRRVRELVGLDPK